MSAKFGGVYLGGAASYEFDLAIGTSPVEKAWEVTAARAARISLGVPLGFDVSGGARGKSLSWQYLYCLEVLPGRNPHQRVLHVADRRWLWSRAWVSAGFNIPRATGQNLLLGDAQVIENQLIQPDLVYAKWSLYPPENGAAPWTALQILDYVFKALGQPYRIEGSIPEVEAQPLELDDTGDRALERVLAYLPGANVYIDLDGTAVVFSTLPPPTVKTQVRGESPYPFLARKHAIYPGDVQTVSRRALRPKNVHVLFTPEVEIRFEASEGATISRDTAVLKNIAPLPDVTLTLGNGRRVNRGSYVTLQDLFTAWGAFGYRNQEMSFDLMRKHALKYGWAAFEQQFGNDPNGPPNVVHQQRASAAVENWRQLWQIEETFMGRISSLKAERVAILNPETALRAPAEAFCDWTRRPSFKGMATKSEANMNQGWAVQGYAALLADARSSPARITIENESAGVFRVRPQVDPYGLSQSMVWGYPAAIGSLPAGTIPSQDMAKANQQREDLYARWDCVELSSTFQMAVVMTCVPASPNDLRRFHTVTIPQAAAGESGAEGPDVYVRVQPGIMTARFAWTDGNGQALTDTVLGRTQGYPPGALVNAVQVQAVAIAMAKRTYTQWRDTPLGSAQVDLDPEVKPQGTLSSVRHHMTGGVAATVVDFNGDRKPVDLWPFLDQSTRRAILKILRDT